MEKKHTPTPWKTNNTSLVDNNDNTIGFMHFVSKTDQYINAKANAKFIVEACNNYERLQSENERMRDLLVKRKKYIGEFPLFVQSLYSDELDEINNILNHK